MTIEELVKAVDDSGMETEVKVEIVAILTYYGNLVNKTSMAESHWIELELERRLGN